MEQIIYSTNSGEFKADKLLPCPFCGGEPEFITIGNDYTKKRGAEIKCTKCMVKRTTVALRFDLEWCSRQAIEVWNKRWQNER
jgi:Lar family restriction alleviation protein